jgi:hypothetical protein
MRRKSRKAGLALSGGGHLRGQVFGELSDMAEVDGDEKYCPAKLLRSTPPANMERWKAQPYFIALLKLG